MFSAITTEEDLRGIVVQQGGAKVIRQVQYSCIQHYTVQEGYKMYRKGDISKRYHVPYTAEKIQEKYLIKENKTIATQTFYKENIE